MKESVIVCVALSYLGCAEQSAPVKAAPTDKHEPASLATTDKSPQRGVINISEDIRKACGITDAEAYFSFDSAQLGQQDLPVLGKLATCFVSGPLAGHQMQLVGHADPRGGSDYNMVLGGSRADTVKTFLVARGLSGARIATSSRGELDARGTDDRTWAEDRRVDVLAR
jgi:peptidoglycan-associated lipoprotein